MKFLHNSLKYMFFIKLTWLNFNQLIFCFNLLIFFFKKEKETTSMFLRTGIFWKSIERTRAWVGGRGIFKKKTNKKKQVIKTEDKDICPLSHLYFTPPPFSSHCKLRLTLLVVRVGFFSPNSNRGWMPRVKYVHKQSFYHQIL